MQLYNISELTEKTGASRRTIHYYVKEGLLPPPEGRGPNARYSEEHLLRLVLIRVLKESVPLRLEGIRELISPMGPRELRNEIRKLGRRWPIRSEGPDAEMIRGTSFGADDSAALGFDNVPRSPRKGKPPRLAVAAMRRAIAEMAAPRRPRSESDAMTQDSPGSELGGEGWFRIRLSDGVEVHYRTGIDDDGKISRLIACARQIFRR